MDLAERAVEIPKHECPACGYVMDAATIITAEVPTMPKAGDFSICARCRAVNVFLDDLALRPATKDEAQLAILSAYLGREQ